MGTGYPDVFAMGKFIKLYNYVPFSECILCVSKMTFFDKRGNAYCFQYIQGSEILEGLSRMLELL